MMATGFDTLTTAKRLKEAGFTEPQAEALTVALADSRQFDLAQLATKADLAELRTEFAGLRTEFERLRVEVAGIEARLDQMATKAELAQQHASIVKWLAGLLVTQAATMILVIVALVTFLRAAPGGHL
jgi:hypothetical protein